MIVATNPEALALVELAAELRSKPKRTKEIPEEEEELAAHEAAANDELHADKVTISAKAGMNLRLANVLPFAPAPAPHTTNSTSHEPTGPVSVAAAVKSYERARSR